MSRDLFFGICLAPYRIDLYNYLYKECNVDIWFLKEKLGGQELDFTLLWKECIFPERYLNVIDIRGRHIALNLKKIIDKSNPRVIYVPEFSIITMQILLLKKIFNYKFKVVSICDDSINMLKNNDITRIHLLSRKLLSPILDDMILCDLEASEWYKKNYNKGKWFPIIANEERVIPKYHSAIPLSLKLIKEYNLEGFKIILFVGRLVTEKNVSILIKSFYQLKQSKVKLVIVGDGNYKKNLVELAKELRVDVIFTGKKENDELFAWYNIADVFVLPSVKEPFGAVTNEALLAGCRVCISNHCGSACLVNNNNGVTFNPNDVSELTSCLKKQLSFCNTNKLFSRQSLMEFTFKEKIKNIFSDN